MSATQLLSDAALLLMVVCATLWGGRVERLGASFIGVGWLATPIVEYRRNWFDPQLAIFSVDCLLLMSLFAISYSQRSLWATLATAFQLIAVMAYPIFWLWPRHLYRAFYIINFSVGYLLVGCVLAGCILRARAPRR